jgi:hypothetical protein
MTDKDLITYFPRLYHMAGDGSWPSIRLHGLLSTTALLDLFEVEGSRREDLESSRRPSSVPINHAVHGIAVIRDQRPLHRNLLERHLVGIGPEDWYRLLNHKVFFFPSWPAVQVLLNGLIYRSATHTVLTVDTAELVRRHREHISISRINTGAMLHGGSRRGVGTFSSIEDHPFNAGRKSPASISKLIAEVAVEYAVPDIDPCVVRVERRCGPQLIEVVLEREIGPIGEDNRSVLTD